MLRDLLNAVPTSVLAAVVCAVGVAASVGAVVAARRWIPGLSEGAERETTPAILGVLATMVGLLLAFSVVVQYQAFVAATDNARSEATHLAQLVRDARSFDREGRTDVQTAAVSYAGAVVADEWRTMRHGQSSDVAAARLDSLFGALQSVEPRTKAQVAFYGDAVQQLGAVVERRRARLDRAQDGPPGLLLVLILLGAAVMLGYSALVGAVRRGFHVVGSASVALVVCLLVVLFVALSYPFSGDIAVVPGVFHEGALRVGR